MPAPRPILVRVHVKYADALLVVANLLDQLGLKKKGPGDKLSEFCNELDEARANQERNTYDRCPRCNGAAIVDDWEDSGMLDALLEYLLGITGEPDYMDDKITIGKGRGAQKFPVSDLVKQIQAERMKEV